MSEVADFVEALRRFRKMPDVFNPWRDRDRDHDAVRHAADIRAEHLHRYLSERVAGTRMVLLAEAPGFQGCHFSGIPMTSERILLGHHRHNDIHPEDVTHAPCAQTSKHLLHGANEPTATIVWKTMKQAGIDTRSVVLWNAFAFHPMNGSYLTNRKPTLEELKKNRRLLEQFLALFPDRPLVPVGRVAEEVLGEMGKAHVPYLRHPANGGASAFSSGLKALSGKTLRPCPSA